MSYSRRIVGSNRWPGPAESSRTVISRRSAILRQDGSNIGRHVGPIEREGDVRLQESHFVAAVEPLSLEAEPHEGPLVGADHLGQCVGELDLAAGAELG